MPPDRDPGIAERCELTLAEAAKYARLKPSWFYAQVKHLPRIKVAGRIFLRKSDVDAFLDSFKVQPTPRP